MLGVLMSPRLELIQGFISIDFVSSNACFVLDVKPFVYNYLDRYTRNEYQLANLMKQAEREERGRTTDRQVLSVSRIMDPNHLMVAEWSRNDLLEFSRLKN